MNTAWKIKKILIPIIVCAIASGFYVYDFVLRVMPEAMSFDLMQGLNVGAGDLGVLSSLFFWGYAPMQIPCGMLFDRFSARTILTIAILFSALATLGFSHTHTIFLASSYRFVMGFMTSFAFVGALVVGANWFRGKHFAVYTGLVQFLGCIGAIVGITPVAAMTEHLGWRGAGQIIAYVGFALALLVWLIVRDAPQARRKKTPSATLKAYRQAFGKGQTWLVALFGFAIWSPVTVFASMWGVPFLQTTAGLDKVSAGSLVSVVWLTIGIGGPLVGWISSRFKSRRWPMILCALTGVLSSCGLLFIHHQSHLLNVLFLIGFGIAASALVIAFGLIVDLQPPEAVGAIVGFTNMAVIFGGITLLPAVGFMMHAQWQGAIQNGVPIYTPDSFRVALLVLPASFILALITAFLVNETGCKKKHKY